jgi:hypothetical protein
MLQYTKIKMAHLYPSIRIGNRFKRQSQLLSSRGYNAFEGVSQIEPTSTVSSGTSLASTKKITFNNISPTGVSNKMMLKLSLSNPGGSAASIHVQTITNATAADGGSFSLFYNGFSSSVHAFNETVANINTDFNKMTSVLAAGGCVVSEAGGGFDGIVGSLIFTWTLVGLRNDVSVLNSMDDATLHVELNSVTTNAGGSANTLAINNVAYLIDRVVLKDSLGRDVQTLYSDEIFLSKALFDGYEKHLRETQNGHDSSGYKSDFSSVDLDSTGEYYIEIPSFVDSHIDLSQSGFSMDVFMQERNTTVSGAASLNLDAVSLVIQGNRLDSDKESEYKKSKGSNLHEIGYLNMNHVLSQSVSISPASVHKIRLDSLVNESVALVVAVRPVDTRSGADNSNYTNLSSVELQDSSGRTIGQLTDSALLRHLDNSQSYYKTVYPNLYIIKFGDLESAKQGNVAGAKEFNGSSYIEITTNGGTAASVLDVWSMEASNVFMKHHKLFSRPQ